MAIKATIEKLDDVPEAIREDYEERDGKFHLKGFVPKDKVEDVTGLKTALGKERDNAKAAARELAKIKESIGEDFDPDEYQNLRKAAKEREEQEITRKGEWDKLKTQMLEGHSKELDKRSKREEHLVRTLTVERIDKEAAMVCGELKGNATLLMPHIRAKTKLVEEDGQFQVRIVDEQGNPRVNADGKYLGIRELVSEMQSQDVFAGAFAGTGNSGGGSSGAAGSKGATGTGGGKPPAGDKKRSAMTVQEKVAFLTEHGQDAFMNLPQ